MFKGKRLAIINTNQNYHKLNDNKWKSNRLWTIATKNAGSLALNLQSQGYYAQSYTMFEYYKTISAYVKIVYYKYWLLYFAPIDTVKNVLTAALKNEKLILDSFPKNSDRAEALIFTSIIPFIKICTISDGPSIEKLVDHLLQVIPKIRLLFQSKLFDQPIKPTLEIIGDFIPNGLLKEKIMGELLYELYCYFPSLTIKSWNINGNIDNMLDNQTKTYNPVTNFLTPYFEHFEKFEVGSELKRLLTPIASRSEHHDMLIIISRQNSGIKRELYPMKLTMNCQDQIHFELDYATMLYMTVPKLLGFLSRKLKILYKPLDSVSQQNLENQEFLNKYPDVGTVYMDGYSSADYLEMDWNYQETETLSILCFMPFLKFCYYRRGPSVKTFITHFVTQKNKVLAEKRKWKFNDFANIFQSDFEKDFNRELDCYDNILNSQDWDFQEALMENWIKCTTSKLEVIR